MANGSNCPKYVSEEFLKNALEEGLNRTDVKVLSFHINLASVGGENYCSDIYCVKVNYVFKQNEDTEPKVIDLILKDMKTEVEEEMLVKSNETAMYKEVVPELEKILGGKELFAPNSSEVVGSWEGYKSIADKIDAISKEFDRKSRETFDPTNCRYKVINHGDLWVNNFLMKDDDLAFIDLQLSNYGSPAIDINYFLYTSVPVDILKRRRYEFLRIYFSQFQETLKSIDFKNIPSWEDFMYEMRRMEFVGVWALLTIFPMLTLSKEASKGNDITIIKDAEVWSAKKRIMFSCKRVEETFKFALDRFNDIGALD